MKKYFPLLLLLVFSAASAQPPCNLPPPYDCTEMNGNALVGTITNAGAIYNMYWPNDGSNRRIFGEAQLMLGAIIDSTIHFSYGFGSNANAFRHYRPGVILPGGINDTNRSLWPTKYRVYRIAKNWERLRESPTKEAYRKDYAEWPVDLGAPVDSAGKPLFLGDQTAWNVWNDADTSNRNDDEPPLRAEVQQLSWVYANDPILQNVIFIKYTIINKSGKTWRNFYAGTYLAGGVANNSSYAGIDSTLELQYLYSALASTGSYGSKIPAFGSVTLQGPVVQQNGSTAYNFGRYIPDAANLFTNGGSTYPAFLPFNALLYTGLEGLDPLTRQLYTDPITGRKTKFSFTGDPTTGSGWIEPTYAPTARNSFRELMLSSGPVTVPANDTVTVVSALVTAQGKDRIHSVSILKHFTRYLRSNYVSLLSRVNYPSPKVSFSVLNKQIILSWDTNAEQTLVNGYRFQGYNVYQGESPNGPWHRIFTTDKNDNITVLSEETYQPEFSSLASRGIQALPNNGVERHLIIERDSILQQPIINGRPYYYTVRAIWENSNNRPMSVESPVVPVTALPEEIVPGSTIIDPLSLIAHSRRNDDALRVEVIDPLKLTNKTYSVIVNTVNDTVTWRLVDTTAGAVLLANQTTVGGEATPIIDGFTLRLRRQLPGVRRDNQTPRGWEYLPASNRWMTGALPLLIMDGFFNGLVHPTGSNYNGRGGSKVKADELKRIEIRFSNTTTQKAYRFIDKVRGVPFNDPAKHPSFEPHIVKRGAGYVYQDYVDVPFTVWEIDSLDGDPVPRQLSVGFLENNDSLYSWNGRYLGLGNINGKWDPTPAANGGNEQLFLFRSPYTDTPSPDYTGTTKNLFFFADSFDVMYVLAARNDTTLKKSNKYSFTEGDVFRITPNYQLKNGTVYTFTTSPGILGNKRLAIEQNALEKITVFPNPYMGGHTLEQSPTRRFVRLMNLPAPSTIRIVSLQGRIIRSFEHTDPTSGTADWDLRNDEGIKVASGMYIIHIDAKEIGRKILKLMVLYPDERFNTY